MKNACFLTFAILCLATGAVNAQYTVLHNFAGADGQAPNGDLTLIGNKLFGMTPTGGANNDGCVFSIYTNGTGYKDLLDFNVTNGQNPYGSLIYSGGLLYGMTSSGGSVSGGVLFSIDTNGTGYTVLFNFGTGGIGGTGPNGTLCISGNMLFGMTGQAVFSIHTNGSGGKELTSLPGITYGSPTLSGGVLYGMTYGGGPLHDGNLFSVDTDGTGYTDLLDFNTTNGLQPYGALIISGNILYGMTYNGGANGVGRLFSLHTDGSGYYNMLDFGIPFTTDANHPFGSLILSVNTLLGMSSYGGANGTGCVFSINTDGSGYKNVYSFDFVPDGNTPNGTLIMSGSTLYGMTSAGGANGDGIIFSLKDPGLGIEELTSNAETVKIFPNPNNGKFWITVQNVTPDLSIRFYNVFGKEIYSTKLLSSDKTKVDLGTYPAGIYLYRILDGKGKEFSSGKFIIGE